MSYIIFESLNTTVIFTYNFRTFDYIEREMEKVPCHIPVLVLGNHRDMGHHRTVIEDKVRYFVDNVNR